MWTTCISTRVAEGAVDSGNSFSEVENRKLRKGADVDARDLRQLTVALGHMDCSTYPVLVRELYPKSSDGDAQEPLEEVPRRAGKLDQLFLSENMLNTRFIATLQLTKAPIDHG